MGTIDKRIPRYYQLLQPTFNALKELGGSGKNDEILNRIIQDLKLPDDVVDALHLENPNKTELSYQGDWARTYLRMYGAIENSARSVWSIAPAFNKTKTIDEDEIVHFVRSQWNSSTKKKDTNEDDKTGPEDDDATNDMIEFPDEEKPWKQELYNIIQNMDPFGFERLSQRLLRECGFTQVKVTKKTGDGGIDGTGKLLINDIFSFHVAFQCKRYKGHVGAKEIRDFRGSLTTDIEKGVMITTGSFTKAAIEEASNSGKQQIDLIDGDEFINKIIECEIGVKPVTVYRVDKNFFDKI